MWLQLILVELFWKLTRLMGYQSILLYCACDLQTPFNPKPDPSRFANKCWQFVFAACFPGLGSPTRVWVQRATMFFWGTHVW